MYRYRITLSTLAIVHFAAAPSMAAVAPQGQQGETVQDSVTAPVTPETVPSSEIAQRAEESTAFLRTLSGNLVPLPAVVDIADALPAFSDTLSRLHEDPAYIPTPGASIRALDGIRRRWAPYQARLDGWKQTLDDRSLQLGGDRDTLRSMQQLWERSEAAAIEDSVPEALLERTSAVLEQIGTTEALGRARLDTVLSLLTQVTEARTAITDIIVRIDSAEQAARGRLLAPDSPNLFTALFASDDTLSVAQEIGVSWNEAWAEVRDYVRDTTDKRSIFIVVFLVVLALVIALQRQSKSWGESRQWPVATEALEGATRVLSRPVSTAILLTVLLWRIALGELPSAVAAVVMLIVIIPVIRLLPVTITRDFRNAIAVLAGVWLLAELEAWALDGSLLQRLILLVIAISVGIGLIWVVRPRSPIRELATGRWGRAGILLAHLGIVLMAASVLANLFGFRALAELLARATVLSAALALVLATVVSIIDALIWALLHTDWARRLNVVRMHTEKLNSRLTWLAHLGLFFFWLGIALTQFGIERPVRQALVDVLGATLSVGTFEVSLGNILAFAVVIWLSVVISRGIRMVLEDDILRRVSLPRGVPAAISTIAHYVALFIGFLLAAAAGGFDVSSLTLLAGAFGVGLGFGLQNVVNNFVSGLILIFERPVQVGDVVDVGGVQGRVKAIGIRASTVRTWSGAEVIVPNGDLISQQVTNWTLSDRLRRMEIAIGVKYGTDPQRVIDLLTEMARQHPDVISDPEAYVIFKGFGESSLDFEVRAWTASNSWWTVKSDLAVAVNTVLKEADIEIPFPQRDLHLRSVDPDVKLGE
jgi:small-conductance mechanosensitive channel